MRISEECSRCATRGYGEDGGNGLAGGTEKTEDERSFLNHEGHDEYEGKGPFDWAAEGGLPQCTRTQIQTAQAAIGGLYLRSRTSRMSACSARRPIERPPPFVLRYLHSSCETVASATSVASNSFE